MANFARLILLALIVAAVFRESEAQVPLFLQAITSALGTIPYAGGPMSTGLLGAKLGLGSKLLYYLGMFGGRSKKPARKPPKKASPSGGQFGGMQSPFGFGGGGMGGMGAMGGGFGGFGAPNPFSQFPLGYDPGQMLQMFAAQGIDPASAMQAMSNFNGGGGGGGQASPFSGNQAVPASQFPFQSGGAPNSGAGAGNHPGGGGSGAPKDDGSDGDVESFFTFLRDMDDNTCISRLICDIGANPNFLGEFSQNIHGIISTLDVSPSSGAFQYLAIMKTGKSEGGCAQRFPQCGDMAYEVVKNVAPTVDLPQNVNSEMINRL